MLCWMAALQFFLCLCKEGGEHKEDDVKVVKVGESKVGTRLAATGLRTVCRSPAALRVVITFQGVYKRGLLLAFHRRLT